MRKRAYRIALTARLSRYTREFGIRKFDNNHTSSGRLVTVIPQKCGMAVTY